MRDALIASIKEAIPTVSLIYLFGSHATGNAGPDSDIDVAVLAQAPLDPVHRWNLAGEIASTLHRDVDLVDLRQASTVLRMKIIRHGVCLYQRNQEAEHFNMTTLSMYQHLQQERATILAGFKQSLHQ